MRKLATIEKIIDLQPIKNSDFLERATIKGWQLVVKKGEFSTGDFCVYFEVDSILPIRPEFEFLRKNCWNSRYNGFRIRTVKLRGQISQGIAFPLSILGDRNLSVLNEGYDLTEELGIQKYVPEIPSCLSGTVEGLFPNFIPKTDEERVQNMANVLKRHDKIECYVSEKLDGTSSSYYINNVKFGVCGRNWEWKKDDKNTYWGIAEKFDIKKKLKYYGGNVAIQGEIIGPGIQKNKYNLEKIDFYVFNVFDINEKRFLNYEEMISYLAKVDLKEVPIFGNVIMNANIDYWVELSKGYSLLNDKIIREGIVIRSVIETYDPEIRRLSFKAINPEFLLKYHE